MVFYNLTSCIDLNVGLSIYLKVSFTIMRDFSLESVPRLFMRQDCKYFLGDLVYKKSCQSHLIPEISYLSRDCKLGQFWEIKSRLEKSIDFSCKSWYGRCSYLWWILNQRRVAQGLRQSHTDWHLSKFYSFNYMKMKIKMSLINWISNVGLRGWLQSEGNGSLPSNPTEESLSMHFQELGASLQVQFLSDIDCIVS